MKSSEITAGQVYYVEYGHTVYVAPVLLVCDRGCVVKFGHHYSATLLDERHILAPAPRPWWKFWAPPNPTRARRRLTRGDESDEDRRAADRSDDDLEP